MNCHGADFIPYHVSLDYPGFSLLVSRFLVAFFSSVPKMLSTDLRCVFRFVQLLVQLSMAWVKDKPCLLYTATNFLFLHRFSFTQIKSIIFLSEHFQHEGNFIKTQLTTWFRYDKLKEF